MIATGRYNSLHLIYSRSGFELQVGSTGVDHILSHYANELLPFWLDIAPR